MKQKFLNLFKVVKRPIDSPDRDTFISTQAGDDALVYKEGLWTWPKFGRVFAFKDIYHANAYIRDYKPDNELWYIFAAMGQGIDAVPSFNRSDDHEWADRWLSEEFERPLVVKCRRIKTQLSKHRWPAGSLTCQAIILVKRLGASYCIGGQ